MYARMRRIIKARNLISHPRSHSGDFFAFTPHITLYTNTANRLPSNGPSTGIQA